MPANVCIIGGGPAGIMLGFLLARAGVPVTVLEKHVDFFRDFRGDTIHPSTLELLYELGLLDKFLALPHSQITKLSATIGDEQIVLPDFTHLPTHAKFIALMPQWDFLNFLSDEAKKFPAFDLRMGWEATGLVTNHCREGLRISGVEVKTPDGPTTIPADLVVGCDGRHATSAAAAHRNSVDDGVPIDVLWFKISRQPDDPENALGYLNFGRVAILINRNSYFQVGYIIKKDSFPQLQQRGLDSFRSDLEQLVPFLTGRTTELDTWDKIKLLTVQVNHLENWALPGLLCIGDAAHAMSPVGGIGINIALQDAVATANRLTDSLLSGTPTIHDLQAVQHYRESAVRSTQRVQILAHKVLNKVLTDPAPVRIPASLRIATQIPGFHYLFGKFIGMGLQPQHVESSRHTT
jgi:2-polyprenyl-6-methoxyphenol hydroxylase-like FAD-dependent oxidoreductase